MPHFGKTSRARLDTVHPDLVEVCEAAIEVYDFSVLCGHRAQAEQDAAVRDGRSKAPWPTSSHNSVPSRGIDLAPYPIDWTDLPRFRFLAGLIIGIGHARGIKIRSGGDWDGDGDWTDQRFNDLPHFELVES